MASFNLFQLNTLFEQMGVYDIVIPFLLIFTIVFGFLEKSNIFGDDRKVKKFNMVIAIVMGLLLVQVRPFVEMINMALPKISVVIVAIVMFLIMVAMFSDGDPSDHFRTAGILWAILIVSVVLVGWAFWSSYTGSNLPGWLSWIWDNVTTIIVIGIFAGIIIFITNDNQDMSPRLKNALDKEAEDDVAKEFKRG